MVLLRTRQSVIEQDSDPQIARYGQNISVRMGGFKIPIMQVLKPNACTNAQGQNHPGEEKQ